MEEEKLKVEEKPKIRIKEKSMIEEKKPKPSSFPGIKLRGNSIFLDNRKKVEKKNQSAGERDKFFEQEIKFFDSKNLSEFINDQIDRYEEENTQSEDTSDFMTPREDPEERKRYFLESKEQEQENKDEELKEIIKCVTEKDTDSEVNLDSSTNMANLTRISLVSKENKKNETFQNALQEFLDSEKKYVASLVSFVVFYQRILNHKSQCKFKPKKKKNFFLKLFYYQ